jgi:hypothetical protein
MVVRSAHDRQRAWRSSGKRREGSAEDRPDAQTTRNASCKPERAKRLRCHGDARNLSTDCKFAGEIRGLVV